VNKTTKIGCKISGIAFGVLMAGSVHADLFEVKTNVSTALTMTETTPLDVGQIFISGFDSSDSGTAASYVIPASGAAATATPGTSTATGPIASTILPITTPTAGRIDITDGAPNQSLDLAVSSTAFTNPAGGAAIVITSIDTSPAAGAAALTLDGTGAGAILIGATLANLGAAGSVPSYTAGNFTGTYTVTINY